MMGEIRHCRPQTWGVARGSADHVKIDCLKEVIVKRRKRI